MTKGQERLIEGFISKVSDVFEDMFDKEAIDQMNADAREGVTDRTYEDIDAIDIRMVLGELNREFHINEAAINALTQKVESVSQLA